MDYSFLVLDKNLKVLFKSKDIEDLPIGTVIDKFYGYNDVINGNMEWRQGDIGNIYSQNRYILCYPVKLGDNVDALVVVSVPLVKLTSNINRVYMIIAFFFVLSVILGFITIHWASREFVTPIRKLSAAAKYISKGNFDERIEIDENMNDEMAVLCSSFNVMAENLAELEKRRREIVANISHDLRSPITSIRGFLQAML